MIALDIADLSCRYGETDVLSGLNLQIQDGEIVCLLGRSGCGKTTLLKAISGLLQPSQGEIALHGRSVSSANSVTPPEQRGIGMIFQDYALFPHLDVSGNIAFGLKDLFKSDVKRRVDEMLELVNLQGLEKRYPHELSGGQQQRVAIARALANNPSVLLLDEPFSNIDSQVRQHLVREIRDILKQQKVAALFVTHSRDEGFAFADTVAVMHKGQILQHDRSFNVYNHPVNKFVAELMGVGNLLECEVINNRQVSTSIGLVESSSELYAQPGQKAQLFLRPQMLKVEATADSVDKRIVIKNQQFMGQNLRTEVQVNDQTLLVELKQPLPLDAAVVVSIQPHDLVLFDDNGCALKTPVYSSV